MESHFGYSKKYTHGQCVALGIVLAARTSREAGYISEQQMNVIVDYVKASGLLWRMPKGIVSKIIKLMAYDKKFVKGRSRFVLLKKELGKVLVCEKITTEQLKKVISNS